MSKNIQSQLFEEETPIVAHGPCKRVLVPFPVDKAYDYIVPDELELVDGDYVCVPLGGREIAGVVWGDAEGVVNPKKLKSIISKYPMKPMTKPMRDFIDWVAHYTLSAKGSVLKMALSAPKGLLPPKPVTGYRTGDHALKKLTPKQRAVLETLDSGETRRAADIAQEAGCSPGVVKTMANKGLLEVAQIYNPAPCRAPDPHRARASLSAGQAEVADHLADLVAQGGYKAALIDGVTGAGKTEVYFEALAQALKQNKQILILLPEIALSNAFLERFKTRFGCNPALWHSNMTPAQRRNTWRSVAEGHSKVVVGARSSLFLPYQNLGLIIVDEEHDPAYKQEDGVIYHARDMAVVRAHIGQIPIALVSATPSLETMHNAWNGRYEHLSLPDRFGGARLPDIEAIDMRADKPERGEFIAPSLRSAVAETIQKGEQALLFLNRRGYAPLTLCRTCGHRMECPRCTAWLVEHKRGGNLQCHHCGFNMRPPKACLECNEPDSLHACGPGVERIYEEAQLYFPDARIMVLASDTAEDNDALKAMLAKIHGGEIDIIIGTQIIAKGHHFPNLTCVGVIDADLGLQGGELRAAERVYQLLHQVAGRAGREERRGRVFLQTFMPDHRIMKALCNGGRDEFLDVEAFEREQSRMPPFSRLVGIIIAGREESEVIDVAKALGRRAPQGAEIQTLGPAPAPLAKLRGRYRYRLLVRANKDINIQKIVSEWVGSLKAPSSIRIYIDIDPQSFL